MTETKQNWTKRIILLALIVIAFVVYFVVPSVYSFINNIFRMFAIGDFAVVKEFVASYVVYAALISAFLMIFTSIWAPLPAFMITFTNANLFGWWKGALLSWSSAMGR